MREDFLDMVLDTSALINLLASGALKPILTSFPVKKLIVAQVYREMKRNPIDNSDCSELLNELVATNLLEKVSINEDIQALELFLELSAEMDDGEAAVMAYALTHPNCLVVLDNRNNSHLTTIVFIQQ